MKTLIIVRHAKSSWGTANQLDFDRALNPRGLRDAPRMGNLLKEKQPKLDKMVSSSANRAITTAKIMAEQMDYDPNQIQEDERIYLASLPDLLQVAEGLDDAWNNVAMFGHNPGMSQLATYLSAEQVLYPTCGMAAIQFEVDSWKMLSQGLGTLLYFEFPKNLPSEDE